MIVLVRKISFNRWQIEQIITIKIELTLIGVLLNFKIEYELLLFISE